MMCGEDDDRARAVSCCLAARNDDDDSDARRAVMRGGGQPVMHGRVQWRWEAPDGGGACGRRPPGSTCTRARGAGASYLLGAIEHDEAWCGYTVLSG